MKRITLMIVLLLLSVTLLMTACGEKACPKIGIVCPDGTLAQFDSDCNSICPGNTTVQLANPAAVHCDEQGGKHSTIQTAEGAFGLCTFPNGKVCGSWDYYRGNCTDTYDFTSFHYQLQNAGYAKLLNNPADIFIVDPDDVSLGTEDFHSLHYMNKTVLAYLSIGEAEDYRSYWDNWTVGSPEFVAEENPDWEGNYRVMFWYDEWQRLTLDRVDELVEVGYDGVYLDTVDSYEYFSDISSLNTREVMIDFVIGIAEAVRNKNPYFLVVPQNAIELYTEDRYADVVNGLGVEDTWYRDGVRRDSGDVADDLEILDTLIEDGKFVLATDYVVQEQDVCSFYFNCRTHDYLGFVSNLALSRSDPIECN